MPEPLVLFILCILCIDVHKNCRFPGPVAVRSKWRRGPDGAGLWCGRDARAPGWAFSHDRVTPRGQNCRSISGPAVVEGGPSVFVSIRVHSWFVFSDDPLFHSRMIHPVVGGRGRGLPETTRLRAACDGVKRVIHEDTRRTTKTHEVRRRGEPAPFRVPDTPSGSPVSLSNDPPVVGAGARLA